jgi:hypothetical protein
MEEQRSILEAHQAVHWSDPVARIAYLTGGER